MPPGGLGRRPRSNAEAGRYIQQRWAHVRQRKGIYGWLRTRLSSYADELTAQIDSEH